MTLLDAVLAALAWRYPAPPRRPAVEVDGRTARNRWNSRVLRG